VAEPPERLADPAHARKLERVRAAPGDAIALGDAAGCIEWVNAAFQQLAGYTAAEMAGKRLDVLRGLDIGGPALDYVMTRFRRGEPSRLQIRTPAKRGRDERWLDIEVEPLGPDEGFVARVRDVTQRRRTEHPAAPMASPGTVGDPPQRPAPVPKLTLRPVDVSRLVMESWDLLETAVPGSTLVDLDLDGNLPLLQADGERLQEVLVGLVRHAADALEGAPGAICVRTSPARLGAERVGVELEVLERGSAGGPPAMAPLAQRRQREADLPAMRRIVEAHGGSLSITSRPGEDRRAVVTLP
jgi:PAS domain S-box-containing protein